MLTLVVKKVVLLVLLLLVHVLHAQDSTKIFYTEEADTLVKQRFIDRYENVFMTKVPTRHMVKFGFSQYYQSIPLTLRDENVINTTSLQVGYEVKILPAFSLALSAHIPNYGFHLPMETIWKNTVVDAQFRWFVDMRKRIRSGRNAGNLSGNYVALNYTNLGSFDYFENNPSVGLKFGFQRRVLNSGFMDFSFALQQNDMFRYGLLNIWSFSSQAAIGFALGDWVKAKTAPLCDILLCNEAITDQWKIRMPELTFGYHLNKIKLGAAYEHKFGKYPLSINIQLDIGLNRGWNYVTYEKKIHGALGGIYNLTLSHEMFYTFSIQPRYYFLQKRQQNLGTGGNGLSGIYTGLNTEFGLYSGRQKIYWLHDKDVKIRQNVIRSGPMLGFQQRIFGHGYFDFNTSYNFQRELIAGDNSLGIRANLGVGFAF